MEVQCDAIDCQAYDEQRNSDLYLPEKSSVIKATGELRGLNVLDMACGTGVYTRLAKSCGAARTVGVDHSREMLKVAESYERTEAMGIEYIKSDVTEVGSIGKFDRILAIWLLNHASSLRELRQILEAVALNLATDGLFTALTVNPNFTLSEKGWSDWKTPPFEEVREPERIVYKYEGLRFYKWSERAYACELRNTGFTRIEWRDVSVPEAFLDGPEAEQWSEFLTNPPMRILTASVK